MKKARLLTHISCFFCVHNNLQSYEVHVSKQLNAFLSLISLLCVSYESVTAA